MQPHYPRSRFDNNKQTEKKIERIFFPHITLGAIRDEDISNYKTRQIQKNTIYSPDGIFEVHDNSVWKMIPNDICVDKSNDKFMVDRSTWRKKGKWYQIPFNHICISSFKCVYKLSSKSMVECVVEKNELGNITDFYMETEFSINVKGVKEDILTFLYALNF